MGKFPEIQFYQSSQLSPRDRRSLFVAREEILRTLVDGLCRLNTGAEKRHFLVAGKRGFGKSFLLSRLEDELRLLSTASPNFAIVRLPGEPSTISSLDSILSRISESLEVASIGERSQSASEPAQQSIECILERRFKTTKQTVVIIAENFDRILLQLRDMEHKKLKKFLQSDNGCILLAAATTTPELITEKGAALCSLFDLLELQPFTKQESVTLLKRMEAWKGIAIESPPNCAAKIMALHDFCDGNPRWMAFVCDSISTTQEVRVAALLEQLLDFATPQFQSLLDEVSPQERAVLEKMSLMRALVDLPRSPQKISEKVNLSQQQTSSLLKRLTDARLVSSTENKVDRRSRSYRVSNRLFDVWHATNAFGPSKIDFANIVSFLYSYYLALKSLPAVLESTLLSSLEEPSWPPSLLEFEKSLSPNAGFELIASWRTKWTEGQSGKLEAYKSQLSEFDFENTNHTLATLLLTNLGEQSGDDDSIEKKLRRSSLLFLAGRELESTELLKQLLCDQDLSHSPAAFTCCIKNLTFLINRLRKVDGNHRNGVAFLSYKWGNETPIGLQRNGIVELLDCVLKQSGIVVLRDTRNVKETGSVLEFAKRLLDANCMVVVLSSPYFESVDCVVVELFQLYQSCLFDAVRFREKLIPVVLKDAVPFLEAKSRQLKLVELTRYWNSTLEQRMANETTASVESRKVTNMVREMIPRLGDMLSLVNDIVLKRGFEEIIIDDFREVLSEVRQRIPPSNASFPENFSEVISAVSSSFGETIAERLEQAGLSLNFDAYVNAFRSANEWLVGPGKHAKPSVCCRVKLYLARLVLMDMDFHRLPDSSIELAEKYLNDAATTVQPDDEELCALVVSLHATINSFRGLPINFDQLAQVRHPIAIATHIGLLSNSLDNSRQLDAMKLVEMQPCLSGRVAEAAAKLFAQRGDEARTQIALQTLKNEASTNGSALPRYERALLGVAEALFQNTFTSTGDSAHVTPFDISNEQKQQLKSTARLLAPLIARPVESPCINTGIEMAACEQAIRISHLMLDRFEATKLANALINAKPISKMAGRIVRWGYASTSVEITQRMQADWGGDIDVQLDRLEILSSFPNQEAIVVEELGDIARDLGNDTLKEKTLLLALHLATSLDLSVRGKAFGLLAEVGGVDHPFLKVAEAKWACDTRDYSRAEALLNERPALDDPDWQNLMAMVLEKQNRPKEAFEHAKRVASMTNHPSALKYLADLGRSLGESEYVINALERLRQIPSEKLKATRMLADHLSRLGSHESLERAAGLYQELAEHSPENPEIGVNAAICLRDTQKIPECLALLSGIHSNHPDDVRAYLLHAQVLETNNDSESAFELLSQPSVKDRFWSNPDYLLVLIDLGYKSGHDFEAFQALMRLRQVEEGIPESEKRLRAVKIDEIKESFVDRRRFHEEMDGLLLRGRLPWTAICFDENTPIYQAWSFRTQNVLPRESASGRANLCMYSSTGFHRRTGDVGREELASLTAPPKGTDVVCDLTSLVTMQELEVLKQVVEYFGKVYIPRAYRTLEAQDPRTLRGFQKQRLLNHKKIQQQIDKGTIRRIVPNGIPSIDIATPESSTKNCLAVGDILAWLKELGRITTVDQQNLIRQFGLGPSGNPNTEAMLAYKSFSVTALALESLADHDLLEPLLNVAKLWINEVTAREISVWIFGCEGQLQLANKSNRLWKTIHALKSVVEHVAAVDPDEEVDDKSDNGCRFSLTSYWLATKQKLPLLADDRVLVGVARNSGSEMEHSCSTHDVLKQMFANGAIDQTSYLKSSLQLICWRYRNILLDETDLLFVAKAYRSKQEFVSPKLRDIARYVQDCMLDCGQFGGAETEDPTSSMALQLSRYWIRVAACFVDMIWTDGAFTDIEAEQLTRWAIDNLVPSNGISIRSDLQVHLMHEQSKLFLVHLLSRRWLREDRSRSAAMMRVLRESLGLPTGEFWRAVFMMIEAETLDTPNDVPATEWKRAQKVMQRNVAKHALAEFENDGGYSTDSRGCALLEASHILRKKAQLEAPDAALLAVMQDASQCWDGMAEVPGPLLTFFSNESKTLAHVVQATELIVFANVEARKSAIAYFRQLKDQNVLSPRSHRAISKFGYKVVQSNAANWYPAAEDLATEFENDWMLNLAGFSQCLIANTTQPLGKLLNSYWNRCIVPKEHPAHYAPRSAFQLCTDEKELKKSLGVQKKEWKAHNSFARAFDSYIELVGHLPLDKEYSIWSVLGESLTDYPDCMQFLFETAKDSDYIRAYHANVSLVHVWDQLSIEENVRVGEVLSNFIADSLTSEMDTPRRRFKHCVNQLANHYVSWMPLFGPEIGDDNTASLAWWLAYRMTKVLVKESESYADPAKQFKFRLERTIRPSVEFSFDANNYFRFRDNHSPFALLGKLQAMGGPFFSSLVLQCGSRILEVMQTLTSEACELVYNWIVAQGLFNPTGVNQPSSILFRNYPDQLVTITESFLSGFESPDPIRNRFQGSRKLIVELADAEAVEKLLTRLATADSESAEDCLHQLRIANWNRSLDTESLLRGLDDSSRARLIVNSLSIMQLGDLIDIVVSIQQQHRGKVWFNSVPHLIASWLNVTDQIEHRRSIVFGVICSSIIGDSPSAIQSLLRRDDFEELKPFIQFHIDRIESLRNRLPRWAWSRLRYLPDLFLKS